MPAIQREILRSAATVIAPGGLLVYSTCSLEMEENDSQVERFLAEHPEWTHQEAALYGSSHYDLPPVLRWL